MGNSQREECDEIEKRSKLCIILYSIGANILLTDTQSDYTASSFREPHTKQVL